MDIVVESAVLNSTLSILSFGAPVTLQRAILWRDPTLLENLPAESVILPMST